MIFMNFFNIDLHISVIADLRSIFSTLGHTIVDKSLSGHTWVFGRGQDGVKVISQDNWKSIDKNFCNRFYEEYKDDLRGYDGFVCTYPPSFSLLYEKFNKPIILQVPIRFEVPFQNNPSGLKRFIDFLRNGIDNKQIIPVCNNLYDKKYCEKYTDREWILIPNVCDYTGIEYKGSNNYVLYSKTRIDLENSNIVHKDDYLGRAYKWNRLNWVKGIIHIPYNVSTMSIFEQYTGNIPLFFPTPEFNMQLYKSGFSLTELSWTQSKEDSIEWIAMSDYYNQEWMPYISYFSSLRNINDLVNNVDLIEISQKMQLFNVGRKKRIHAKWSDILNDRRFSK